MSQPPPDPEGLPPTLDYGRPPPPVPASKAFGRLCAVIAAVVAVPAWGVGILAVIGAFNYGYRADRAGSLYQAGVILAIAIVCTAAAVRWIR
jgi:hypothetical protein